MTGILAGLLTPLLFKKLFVLCDENSRNIKNYVFFIGYFWFSVCYIFTFHCFFGLSLLSYYSYHLLSPLTLSAGLSTCLIFHFLLVTDFWFPNLHILTFVALHPMWWFDSEPSLGGSGFLAFALLPTVGSSYLLNFILYTSNYTQFIACHLSLLLL